MYTLFNLLLSIISSENGIRLLFKYGFIGKEGEPLKCQHCGHTKFKTIVVDRIGYTVSESKEMCRRCDKMVGYWSYGNWEL